jgi:hypothetical protein
MGVASKIEFVAKFSCPGDGVITTLIEQFPNVQSRISLLDEKDELGVAKVNVNWVLSADDRHTIKCIGNELAKQFAEMGLGFIKLSDYVYDTSLPLVLSPHAHHMGHHADGGRREGRGSRYQLQGVRHRKPLCRRQQCLRHRRGLEPDHATAAVRLEAGRPPQREDEHDKGSGGLNRQNEVAV